MEKQKRILATLAIMVSLVTFATPAQAQFFGGQQSFDGDQSMGGPMGMGLYGMPFMYPGMPDMPGMPFASPFGGMMARQSEHVTAITRLPSTSGYGKDIMSVLESSPQLSTFTAAVKAAGYDGKLRGRGNYVVFAPTDKAIARDLSVRDAQSLANNPELVAGLVNNCIAHQPPGQQADSQKAFVALNGKEVRMVNTRSGPSANGADILDYLGASNGWVVVTDGAVGT